MSPTAVPDPRSSPWFKLGYLDQGVKSALIHLEFLIADEATPAETRKRLEAIAKDLRQTLSVLA